MSNAITILLGASTFPKFKRFSNEAFKNSYLKIKEYCLEPTGLNVQAKNILDLFETEELPANQYKKIISFLSTHTEATDLIFYYVGHGYYDANQEYCLACRCTDEEIKSDTGIRIKSLADALRKNTSIRKFILLDCCFAGEAVPVFQSELHTVTQKKIETILNPKTGTALLLASSKDNAAISPPNNIYTMFTSCLIEVLKKGIVGKPEKLTLSEIRDEVEILIQQNFPDNIVRPEVHSPYQPEADLATTYRLFPNQSLNNNTLANTNNDTSLNIKNNLVNTNNGYNPIVTKKTNYIKNQLQKVSPTKIGILLVTLIIALIILRPIWPLANRLANRLANQDESQQEKESPQASIEELIESDYNEEVIDSKIPVLLWICADYEETCTKNNLVIQNITRYYANKIKVLKLDWRVNSTLAKKLNAELSPTLILYKDGKEINRLPGAVSYQAVTNLINKSTQSSPEKTSSQQNKESTETPIEELIESDYNSKVITSKTPILLWVCTDYEEICERNDPIVKSIARNYANKIKVLKLDREINKELTDKLKTSLSPTLIFYKDGKEIKRLPGAVSYEAVVNLINTSSNIKTNTTEKMETEQNKENLESSIEELVESDYNNKVIASKTPILLWVCANYTQTCQKNIFVIKDIAKQYATKIKILKLDWDVNEQLAKKLKTYLSPTLILYKDGKEIKRLPGAVSYEAVTNLINTTIIIENTNLP